MNAISFALVLTGVLLNAAAQLLLKAGVSTVGEIHLSWNNAWTAGTRLAFEPHILGGLTCYVVSVCVWIVALSRVPVSIAYPMLSIGYVVNAIAARFLLGEEVSLSRLIGIGVIIVGVYIVARS
ncbi:MAG: SMR family transporter [Gammaproteobacteria bacterium]|jgi:multidrug transporter EmrE-like cation transporter